MTKEFAPGIVDKSKFHELPHINSPTTWEYGIHHHLADKRGEHYDLRLGNKETGHAYSWAMLPKLPSPGESTMIIEQPTHTVKYMDWEGTIPKNTYGAGKVKLKERDKAEIINAKPGHITFNVYKGYGPEEYTIHKMGGKIWKLMNRTKRKEDLIGDIDLNEKPKYKDISVKDALKYGDEYLMSAKIDDAHNLFIFPKKGEQIRSISYREAKRTPSGLIEHTHKIPSLINTKTPKELEDTVLRGGLYAKHPETKEATPHNVLGGLLNSNVWKSREKQEEHGDLIPIIYDVVRYKGKDMKDEPYKEKLKALVHVNKVLPEVFELPKIALEKVDKEKMLHDIEHGNLPETKEGIVLWHLHESKPALKAKFINEHDVYIRGFFPGGGRLTDKGVGGFVYSHEPNGPIVGEVGTGFDDKLRNDMYRNPDKFIGLVATVGSQHKYDKTKALRAPAFLNFHLDKNEQSRLDEIN